MIASLKRLLPQAFHKKKQVAIVTPVYRLPLTPDEEVSLRHLRHYLGQYDRLIIAPQSLDLDFPDFQIVPLADECFSGILSYNKLLLSQDFYKLFCAYEYILIYQLDCLVFSGDLDHWCRQGWDYAGAPWFKGYKEDIAGGLWAVGNGGLSLRRVQSALDVLSAKKRMQARVLRKLKADYPEDYQNPDLARSRTKKILRNLGLHGEPKWFLDQFVNNEDRFWGLESKHLVTSFHVPEPSEALRFSIECSPRLCFEQNGGQLPFGCHAWAKYDRQFWQPFLLND